MSLPILIAPTFDIVVPSTDKRIKCRPFLVKEEKILLTALEGKDEQEQIDSVKQILNNCIVDWNGHKLDTLALFDLEYIFLKLRCRSKGEKTKIRFNGLEDSDCTQCQKIKVVEIDLSKIEITKNPEHNKRVQLNKEVGLVMTYPKFNIATKFTEFTGQGTDFIFAIIRECIESIYDKENVYNTKDFPASEIDTFLENLTADQFSLIEKFFETMPKLEHTIDLSCGVCGRKEEYKLNGLQDFFQ